MMWRMLLRRVPSRSMTVVGDLAQTRSAAGASSWAAALEPHVPDRWRVEQLTVNYRTPAQIMETASRVLQAHGVDASSPDSVREGTWPPVLSHVPRLDPAAVVAAVGQERDALSGGRLAVVTVPERLDELTKALADDLPEGAVGSGATAMDAPVAVLEVEQAKGLEFDGVLLIEPAEVLEGSPRGANDLYVAMTRPTQRLRVLHERPLPQGF